MAFEPSISIIDHLESGFIAMMPRPVPGEWIAEEFARIAKFDIHLVVSLLESQEADDIGLSEEAAYCERNNMAFISYPIPDRGLPDSIDTFTELTSSLNQRIRSGENTVIHCRAGIGRAGLVTAGILLHSGFDPNAAFLHISKARGLDVPDTGEQKQWLIGHYEAICNTHRTKRSRATRYSPPVKT